MRSKVNQRVPVSVGDEVWEVEVPVHLFTLATFAHINDLHEDDARAIIAQVAVEAGSLYRPQRGRPPMLYAAVVGS